MSDALQRISAALAGRYLVERELGRGGMATVYLAQDVRHHRAVAIKVLSDEISAAIGAERFLREIEIAASLTHPNILPLLDSGETGGRDSRPYYVMPFIEGETLRERMSREGQLPVDEAVRLGREVADALQHAHDRGVIHRDIKPENILLAGGHAMVADFGVARALAQPGVKAITKTGMAVGTPQYMSPEQAAADPSVDTRSDLYALGTLLYEMLAGTVPYPGPTAHAILARKMSGPPPSLRVVRPTVSDALERAVFKSMEIAPADRFKSAQAFSSALESAITPQPMPATGVVPAQAARRPLRSWLLVVAAAAVLAAGVLILLRPKPAPVAVDAEAVAVLPFRVDGADTSVARYRIGMLDLVHASLNGEGGPRAMSPATVLSAWRRMVSSEAEDLPDDQALDLARRLGAGRVLTGSIVAVPRKLVLHASLLRTSDGERIEAQAEGAPDSVLAVVDRLVADLLVRSKVGAARPDLRSLTTRSLPALRAFLDGQVAYRDARYLDASRHFESALALDSTFALAAIGYFKAAGWGSGGDAARGIRIAWNNRERLGARDRALLDNYTGPRYPAQNFSRSNIQAAERLVQLAPDDPEAYQEYGDALYHFGDQVDYPDPWPVARRAFERAVALDSGFAAPLDHLIQITAATGDTAALRRFFTLRRDLVAKGAAPLRFSHYWRYAQAFEDQALLDSLRRSITPESFEGDVIQIGMANALDLPTIETLLETNRRAASTEGRRRFALLLSYQLALNNGQPARAARLLDSFAIRSPDSRVTNVMRVMGGLYWQLDSAVARAAAEALSRTVGPSDRWGAAVFSQMWRMTEGDTSRLEQTIRTVREAINPPGSTMANIDAEIWTRVLEAIDESRRGSGRSALERLDSLLASGPQQSLMPLRMANLEAARLFERDGRPERALRAVRRRAHQWQDYSFLSTVTREEGRLAALTGDKAGAIAAYQMYLRFRTNPEPSLVPERERIKTELA
ncbi:MAG TPA: protein kinase, partial [Gemmatimonadales bacterium]|nr:protein kinase [Gemmatimonadales bacterium]